MSEKTKDHVKYRSVQASAEEWIVFAVDDRRPSWWQVVATFSDKSRAVEYAEMENMFLQDFDETPGDARRDITAQSPTSPLPSSALPQLVRRETLTHTRLEREETVTLAPQAREVVSAPVTTPTVKQIPPPQPKPVTAPQLVDAGSLPPLTNKQAAAFKGLVLALEKSGGERPTYSEMERYAGLRGMVAYLAILEAKGYAENVGEYGSPDWRVKAKGQPRIDYPRDGSGRVIRHWEDHHLELLKTNIPDDGDYSRIASQLDRSATACEQMARKWGWYVCPAAPAAAVEDIEIVDEDIENDGAPATSAPIAPTPQPEPEEDGEEIDVDDLSKAGQEALCIIAELFDDKVHPIKERSILEISEIDEGRLPLALTKLAGQNLIRRDSVGSWYPTKMGIGLAASIRKIERIAA